MVNFKKHLKETRQRNVTDLNALFESLDRHATHVELRPVQISALETLTKRRLERDLVLKLSTGSGKTVIGMLYLLSHMEATKQPGVYLVKTRQLAEQTCAEASKVGIKAVPYLGGETFPHIDGTTGQAVIVSTYEKLFNAKSTFDRDDVMLRPQAVVLDDVHAGIEGIRDQFTLRVPRDHRLYSELVTILDGQCNAYKRNNWTRIKDNVPHESIEIPYWIWRSQLHSVEDAISKFAGEKSFIFVEPFLRDIYPWCRCVVTGAGLEVAPFVLPVDKCPAFDRAPFRLFMSATLADDSVLVSELDCAMSAARQPITPRSDRGIGERMVLAPSLVHESLNRKWVMELCAAASKKYRTVVLSPSDKKAREWESVGAKVFVDQEVATAVADLRDEKGNIRFAVFQQRYDGIDLPDNSCRVLVIDGLPSGDRIIDRHDMEITPVLGGSRNKIIYRIEQGMGRAVRSYADYAVIILVGPELCNFVARREVLDAMNAGTRAQVRLAIELAKLAVEEQEANPGDTVVDMMKKCLGRNPDWRQYYEEAMKDAEHLEPDSSTDVRLRMAEAERKAFSSAVANDAASGARQLLAQLDSAQVTDKFAHARYLQLAASYLHASNPGESAEVQRSAFEKNRLLMCPPGAIKRAPAAEKYEVQARIITWLKSFENPNGALLAIEDLRGRLSLNNSAPVVEQAICDLAPLLGAAGSRPERETGEGPDDLWLWPETSYVLECKNENETSIHKRDAGQLLLSVQWFERTFEQREKAIPIIVAKSNACDRLSDFPAGTRTLTSDGISAILDNLQKFYRELIAKPLLLGSHRDIRDLQESLKLNASRIAKHYAMDLKEQ